MTSNALAVQDIYAALSRGDIPIILAHMAEDVRWEEWEDNTAQKSGVTWLQARQGKAGVLAFFQLVGQFTIIDFRILSVMEGDRQVAVEFVFEAQTPAGSHYRDEEIHLWSFNEAGQVVRLRHYTDTAKQIAAANPGQDHGHPQEV